MTTPTERQRSHWISALVALVLLVAGAAPSAAQDFHVEDYGYVADTTYNNHRAFQQAADAAYAGREPGQIAWIVLPDGTMSIEGAVNIVPDSLGIKGCGGGVLTVDYTSPTSVTGGGEVYYPVRRADHVTPGACVSRVKVLDSALRVVSPNGFVQGTRIRLTPEVPFNGDQRFHRFWIEDVVLDGNSGNLLDALWELPQVHWKKNYQDSPTHTGLDAGRNGNRDWCLDRPRQIRQRNGGYNWLWGTEVGLLVSAKRVVVEGFMATGFLGDYCSRWELDTVRGADAWFNHIFYKADGGGSRGPNGELLDDQYNSGPYGTFGGWTDVTLAGASWTETVVMRGADIKRLVYEDYRVNPLKGEGSPPRNNGSGLINVRRGGTTVSCLRVADRYPNDYDAAFGIPGVFAIQDDRVAWGHLAEDGLEPDDCTPPASKVVAPGAVVPPSPGGRRFVTREVCEDVCIDARTGEEVPGGLCDAQDRRRR